MFSIKATAAQEDFDKFLKAIREQARTTSEAITLGMHELLIKEAKDNEHTRQGQRCNRERGE